MSKRWAKGGLDPQSEVQEFLDLAFSMCPQSPYEADRFVREVGLPPGGVRKRVWEAVEKRAGWPRHGAAVPKVLCLSVFTWDLQQWAGQMREEPQVLVLRVRRSSIECFGPRPKPVAKHLSKDLSKERP